MGRGDEGCDRRDAGQWFNRGKTFTAHATFVGAQLNATTASYSSRAIGDSVAFHVRDGKIVDSFPLTKASEFSNVVHPLSSTGEPRVAVAEKTWRVKPGDEVFMATDALAAWVLVEVESGRSPFAALRQIDNSSHMTKFVEQQRERSSAPLAVDDTSFVRIVVP